VKPERRVAYFALLALGAIFVFGYSFLGDALFPRAVVAHIHADGQTASVILDRSVVFHYGEPIKVAAVIDGDTIQLINGEYVRYNGIDTPEEFDPRKNVQCYAKEAAAENARLIDGGGDTVTVYQDVSYKDKYGRWIGLIYLDDGTFVNGVLVKEGYAFAYKYKPDIANAVEFKADETEARSASLGIWSHCTVYKTSSGREQTNDL
jgi:endonuclease YncB( thermonuclease family)